MAIFFCRLRFDHGWVHNGAPGLDDGLDPRLRCNRDGVGLGQECIRYQNTALGSSARPADGMDRGVNTASLTAAYTDGLCAFDQDNGITFDMLDQFPAENHGLHLGLGRLYFADDL